jgi:hypothetical protein
VTGSIYRPAAGLETPTSRVEGSILVLKFVVGPNLICNNNNNNNNNNCNRNYYYYYHHHLLEEE